MQGSIYAISAMCGCMWGESSLNPNIWESNDPQTWDTVWHRNEQGFGVGGFGLGQWTNTREQNGTIAWRLRDFHDWCLRNNYDIHEGTTQLIYIMYENVWFNVYHKGSNAQTLTEFIETDSTNLDGLVEDFLANWEGVPGDRLAERQANARKVFNYITQHESDISTVKWAGKGNTWILTESETLNNALCYFAFFNGYIPPNLPPIYDDPDSPANTGKRKGLPVWMMLKPWYK